MGRNARPRADLVDRVELARILGCGSRNIANLEQRGMPIEIPGGPGVKSWYSPTVCRHWYAANVETQKEPSQASAELDEYRARREAARAKLAELEYQERAGDLIRVEDAQQEWRAHLTAARSKLLSLPSVWADRAGRAYESGGADALERLLTQAIHEVLTELAAAPADYGDEVAK